MALSSYTRGRNWILPTWTPLQVLSQGRKAQVSLFLELSLSPSKPHSLLFCFVYAPRGLGLPPEPCLSCLTSSKLSLASSCEYSPHRRTSASLFEFLLSITFGLLGVEQLRHV